MSSYLRLRCMIVVITLFQLSPNALSQESVLEEIRVKADPLGDVDNHFIQPVHVMDKEELKRRSVQNIGETVSGELGVSSSDFGVGVGRPVIRGLGGGRVKVMEDGIGTMDASVTSADHAVTSEPAFAQQIEILRGPATLLYGSGTSGGLVNVVSNRIPETLPEEGIEGDIVTQYETVSEGFLGAASLNAGGEQFAVHFDGMIRDRKDYDIPGFAESDPDPDEESGTLENSAMESETVSGGVSWIGNRGFAGFSISNLNTEYGIPGEHHHEEDHEEEHEEEHDMMGMMMEEEEGVIIDMEQTRYDIKASLETPVSGFRKINTRWGYNDYEHAEIEGSGEVGTRFDIEELEGRIELLHNTLFDTWDGALGIHVNNRDFIAVGEEAFVPASQQDSLAFFLIEKGDYGPFHVDLGFRYEDVSSDSVGVTVDEDAFSVSGGINWEYLEGYEAGLSISRSERIPGIEELFSNGPHLATNAFEIGNTNLDKETSNNIDIYWRKTEGRFRFTANMFWNNIDDFIFQQEQDLNGDSIADRVEEDFSGDPADILPPDEDEEPLLLFHTQDDAEFFGFELEGILTLFDDNRGTMDWRVWTDYVEGERDGGQNLPRITPWRAGMELSYFRGPLTLSMEFTHTGDQQDTASLETSTEAYDMLNIYGSYTLDYNDIDFTIFARGTNLLDEEIRRHTSFVKDLAPLPGASGIFGLRASF